MNETAVLPPSRPGDRGSDDERTCDHAHRRDHRPKPVYAREPAAGGVQPDRRRLCGREEYLFEGVPLSRPADAQTGDPVHDGGRLFFQYGCASCHGLQGGGAARWAKTSVMRAPARLRRRSGRGPKTMPGFSSSELSDEDMDKLIAFLQSGPKQ